MQGIAWTESLTRTRHPSWHGHGREYRSTFMQALGYTTNGTGTDSRPAAKFFRIASGWPAVGTGSVEGQFSVG
jgi:hypothetical protein